LKKLDLKSLIFGQNSAVKITAENNFGPLPVAEIRGGVVITTDGRYVKILELSPVNFYLKSAVEQQNIIWYFASYLKIAPENIQLLVRTGRADIDAYCENMERFWGAEQNENCRDMILENAGLVNELAENEAMTRRFFLAFACEGPPADFENAALKLSEDAGMAAQYLDCCGLERVVHEDENEFLRGLFPIPESLDFTHKNYAAADGTYHSCIYIPGYGYPTQAGLAWLSPLVEAGEGVNLSFFLSRKRREKILPKIAKATMLGRTRMKDIGDTRMDYEELDSAILSGLYMKDEMNRNGEDFYYMNTLAEITAPDTDTLERRVKAVETLCASLDFTARRADYKQEQAYFSAMPLVKLDADLDKKSRRNILTSGAAAAFPFSSFELCDPRGVLLGVNQLGRSAVILDLFDAVKYSNANLSVMGMSGAGKTFLLQLIALRMRLQDVQVFIIAPLKGHEFRAACEAIGGRYIKLSPGSADQINLLEIRRGTLDTDAEISDGRRGDSVLADKIQKVHIFFSLLYPDISLEERQLLDAALIETYAAFGVTHDNASLFTRDNRFKTMPTLTDLHGVLSKDPNTQKLALVLSRFVSGSGQASAALPMSISATNTSCWTSRN